MRKIIAYVVALVALLWVGSASAQHYSWGSDPASLKWRMIKDDSVRVIYPTESSEIANQTYFYIKAVSPYIDYGFERGPLNIPFVLHPENFASNGLVMWMPKRVDFLTSPSIDGFSMPWIKQLVAHEYRHAVQYNNLNRGFSKALSYVLGQQGSVIGVAGMPIWALEGDAVMTETAMSSYGRGLQPSFSIEYRAFGDRMLTKRNADKWFCGSYKEFVPDHYRVGYQISSYADNHYGENIWDRVAWYSSRNLYLITTTYFALNKYYDTSTTDLFHQTFAELNEFWRPLAQRTDSSDAVVELPHDNYTSYEHPRWLDDGRILALKSSLSQVSSFVIVDPRTGEEEHLHHTGSISSRPMLENGRVWWTEYSRSTLFEQRVNSQLYYMDVDGGRPRAVRKQKDALYATPMRGDSIAWVEYWPSGEYSVQIRPNGADQYPIHHAYAERFAEIHGLAWDNKTDKLFVLITDNSGMWIGQIVEHRIVPVTEGAYITLSNLSAKDGFLWFGSIESGLDEIHCYDIENKKQYRLTDSRYGSFSADVHQAEAVMTTYSDRGYHLATQKVEALREVTAKQIPTNIVNPERRKWDVINLDTVNFALSDTTQLLEGVKNKRYRKALNLFNFHSWAPLEMNPFNLNAEEFYRPTAGLTLMSQNLLSSLEGYVSYGWSQAKGNQLQTQWDYTGLGVRLGVNADYGGPQSVYGMVQGQVTPELDKYYSVGVSAAVPLILENSYHTRQLYLSTAWQYNNGLMPQYDMISGRTPEGDYFTPEGAVGFYEGVNRVSLGVGYYDSVRGAHRDFHSPWSYSLQANYYLEPTNDMFNQHLMLVGSLRTPGLLPNNSVGLTLSYQTALTDNRQLYFGANPISIPTGYLDASFVADGLFGASLRYELPVWYPDAGWNSIIYFKRLRVGLGVDYAYYKPSTEVHHLYSYGVDLTVDCNVFRAPAAGTTAFTLSVYQPKDGDLWATLGLALPF